MTCTTGLCLQHLPAHPIHILISNHPVPPLLTENLLERSSCSSNTLALGLTTAASRRNMFIFASASNLRQIPPQAAWQGVVWMARRIHRASSLLEVPGMSVHSRAVGCRERQWLMAVFLVCALLSAHSPCSAQELFIW